MLHEAEATRPGPKRLSSLNIVAVLASRNQKGDEGRCLIVELELLVGRE